MWCLACLRPADERRRDPRQQVPGLRAAPRPGLDLQEGGWASIDALIAGAALHGRNLDAAMISRVINAPGKQRFELRDGLIRAAQGHSVRSTWA
jgi:RNA:NAD 2'-phosphotransferase (TPT1/KptA family)